jgi:UDP-glucuronate 4-epimerase
MTKMAGEQMCSNYSHLYGIKTVCLRFFTVYGPRASAPTSPSRNSPASLRTAKPIDKYGDGTTAARLHLHANDIVDGIIGALNYRSGPICDIFNLGGSQTVTLNDLDQHHRGQPSAKKPTINQLPEQPGDVPMTSADVSKAQALLNFRPKTTIAQGVPEYVAWFRQMRDQGVIMC